MVTALLLSLAAYVLATNTLAEGVDASPVIVGRHLYLRGAKHLYPIGPK